MTPESRFGRNVIPFRDVVTPTEVQTGCPDMTLSRVRRGIMIRTLTIWSARMRVRRELRQLAISEPDSVLEDAGLTRAWATLEGQRWFWQKPLPQGSA